MSTPEYRTNKLVRENAQLTQDLATAQAEIARLREALGTIRHIAYMNGSVQTSVLNEIFNHADKALSQSSPSLQEYRDMKEWFSVEDKLPDDAFYVLGYCNNDLFIAEYAAGLWFNKYLSTGCNVTHWMHLPASPKDSDKS